MGEKQLSCLLPIWVPSSRSDPETGGHASSASRSTCTPHTETCEIGQDFLGLYASRTQTKTSSSLSDVRRRDQKTSVRLLKLSYASRTVSGQSLQPQRLMAVSQHTAQVQGQRVQSVDTSLSEVQGEGCNIFHDTLKAAHTCM